MRRTALAVLVALVCLVGCGKSGIVAVKRTVLPIYVCAGHLNERCLRRFDVGQLIGMRLAAAEEVAEKHGYNVRAIAPLGDNEFLTADFDSNRLDVECDSTPPNCVVVRYVERG